MRYAAGRRWRVSCSARADHNHDGLLGQRLAATRGSVSDIFLPDPVARTIPIWSTALVIAGVLFHVRSVLSSRPRSTPTPWT